MKQSRKARRAARQLFRLCLVDGVLDHDRVRQVARGIAGSRRTGALPILSGFSRLVRLERERRTAVVETATPLDSSVRETVQVGLARVYGRGLETSFGENPELIGGLRIKVGSDVYDGTVRARLAALAARL